MMDLVNRGLRFLCLDIDAGYPGPLACRPDGGAAADATDRRAGYQYDFAMQKRGQA